MGEKNELSFKVKPADSITVAYYAGDTMRTYVNSSKILKPIQKQSEKKSCKNIKYKIYKNIKI